MAGADQTGRAHQPCDPLAPVPLTLAAQVGVNARRAIGLPRGGMDGPDPLQQRRVGFGMG
jgi:hypothetical protein